MKILHVYKDYYPVLGGIENHIRWQAEGMQARGHDVQVLVTNVRGRTARELISGIPVTKAARQFNVSSAPVALSLPGHLWRMGRDVDIIHLHAPYPPGELAQLAVRAGRRTVITYHSDIIKQAGLLHFYAPFLRMILHHADKVLVSNPPYIRSSPFLSVLSNSDTNHRTQMLRRDVENLDPTRNTMPQRSTTASEGSNKVEVVHFGIDLERFAATRKTIRRANELRSRYGFASKGAIVLFVGRLRYYKGVSVLIRAMKQVSDAQCVIVGTGPLEDEARRLIERSDLVDRVHLAGAVADEDLPAMYHAADIFVLPSIHRSESLGIVLLEAMASGLPLISTELGTGTSYVNEHQKTGLVVPPNDVQKLAAALHELAQNRDKRRQFGRAALARARESFSLEHMLDRTEEVYEGLLVDSPCRG